MTTNGIRREFEKLPSADQARLLQELMTSLVKSMSEEDRQDRRVFKQRRKEETVARPWSEVESSLSSLRGRRK